VMVGKKLYVGNLTFQISSAELEQLFFEFGTVESAQVIQDRDTGRSKGFGFVEMGSEAEAQAAIQGLHDQEINGRRLTVNEARPREPRSGGCGEYGGGRGRSGGGRYLANAGGKGGKAVGLALLALLRLRDQDPDRAPRGQNPSVTAPVVASGTACSHQAHYFESRRAPKIGGSDRVDGWCVAAGFPSHR